MLRTPVIVREDVYTPDGMDYLYTKWTIDCIALYNNGYTAYGVQNESRELRSDGQGTVPVHLERPFGTGATPTLTDHALRHRLSQPRRLILFAVTNPFDASASWNPGQDEIVLQAPGTDPATGNLYSCDPAGGPFPHVHDILALSGGVAFQVRFGVVAHVNECRQPNSLGDAPAARRHILSNRFTMTTSWDEAQLATITVEGEAVFRKDRLTNVPNLAGGAGDVSPDQYRDQLFLPVRQHFQRVGGTVTVKPDGSGLLYRYVDVERPVSFSNRRNAVQVSAVHRQVLSNRADVQQAGIGLVSQLLGELSSAYWARAAKKQAEEGEGEGGVKGAAEKAAVVAAGTVVGGPAGGEAAAALVATKSFLDKAADLALKYAPYVSAAGSLMTFAENVLPQFMENCTVTVIGNRRSSKRDLYFLALAIATGKVSPPWWSGPIYNIDVTYDLFRQFVRVSLTYQYSFTFFGASGVMGGIANMMAGPSDVVIGGRAPWGSLVPQIVPGGGLGGIAGGPLVANVLQPIIQRLEGYLAANDPNYAGIQPDLRPTALFKSFLYGFVGLLPETDVMIGNPWALAPLGTSLNPLPWGDGRSYGTDLWPGLAMPGLGPCQAPVDMRFVGNPYDLNTNPQNPIENEPLYDYYRTTDESGQLLDFLARFKFYVAALQVQNKALDNKKLWHQFDSVGVGTNQPPDDLTGGGDF